MNNDHAEAGCSPYAAITAGVEPPRSLGPGCCRVLPEAIWKNWRWTGPGTGGRSRLIPHPSPDRRGCPIAPLGLAMLRFPCPKRLEQGPKG